jgi:ubiquinone/menaquinone biosynthesis C-methylase UbiE
MAASALPPGSGEFDSLLAAVRARSASCGAERVRRALLERLAVGSRDRVLELGFGSGRLLFAVAVRAAQGFVAGVEPEAYALRHASRRCERLVREGRVRLLHGSSRDLSAFGAASFDKVYGVHVTDFWEDPLPHLGEIRRVLRPGGRLLLGACGVSRGLVSGLAATGFRETRSSAEGALVWTTAC